MVAPGSTLPLASVLPQPTLHQPFIVGPGFSPVSGKLVGQTVTGKFVDLGDLLPTNNLSTEPEPEPQILFDGRLVLTPAPKKSNRVSRTSLHGWRHSRSSAWSWRRTFHTVGRTCSSTGYWFCEPVANSMAAFGWRTIVRSGNMRPRPTWQIGPRLTFSFSTFMLLALLLEFPMALR